MKHITKKEIIDDVSSKRCWDISKDFAHKATKDIPTKPFLIFSIMHYTTIYSIIKAKLEDINDSVQRIAYLDCLSMNYMDKGSERINAALDIATGVLSGGVLGFSISDLSYSSLELACTLLMILVFQAIKAINLSFRKWDFYQMVLSQLKSELSKDR